MIEELRRILVGFRPEDEEERRDLGRILDLVFSAGEEAARRWHFAPGHLTASLFIVHPPSGRLLLHHHRRLDRWLQMGGHIEPGESPAVAALREGREESGLVDLVLLRPGPFDLDVHPIPAGKGEPAHLHFDLRYLGSTSDPGSAKPDRLESHSLAWLSLEDAAERMGEAGGRRAVEKVARPGS